MSDVDRTPKPCLHKIANHQHGTYASYILDRCRCLRCAFAASEYHQQRVRRNAYGRSNYVDAGPAREHVAALMAAGIGLKRIVKVSGVSKGGLWKLVYGKKNAAGVMVPSKRITRATADRLLALDPANPALLADGAKVPAVGAARRLQALACLGWSINRLAAEGDLDRQALDAALAGRPIFARTARAVTALYERLWDQPAPAGDHRERISVSRTLNRAKAADWAPPLAWDDDTIDNPDALPTVDDGDDQVDEHAIELVLDSQPMRLTGRDLEVAVERLAAAGLDAATIAGRVHSDTATVRRIRNMAQQRTSRRRAAA